MAVTYALLSLMILLQYFDGLTTYRLLSKGGRELNPVVSWFIERFGLLNGLVIVKGGLSALLAWAAIAGLMPWWLLAVLCVLYIVVVAHRATQIEWEYATEVRRDWSTLVAVQAVAGLTDEQVDDLFIAAAAL